MAAGGPRQRQFGNSAVGDGGPRMWRLLERACRLPAGGSRFLLLVPGRRTKRCLLCWGGARAGMGVQIASGLMGGGPPKGAVIFAFSAKPSYSSCSTGRIRAVPHSRRVLVGGRGRRRGFTELVGGLDRARVVGPARVKVAECSPGGGWLRDSPHWSILLHVFSQFAAADVGLCPGMAARAGGPWGQVPLGVQKNKTCVTWQCGGGVPC